MSQDVLINGQRLQAAQLHRNIATAVGNEALSGVAASQANNRAQNLQENVNDLYSQVDHLKKEVQYYQNLLAKPMHEIANQNENFKKTYELQQELLANWMVSQRAFKELAIDLGLELGKSKEEVIAEGMAERINVIENNTQHDNNMGDDFYVKPYVDKIKSKL
jgi:hypothetical protein